MAAISPNLVNIGVSPNDGTGDPLRVAFQNIRTDIQAIFDRGAPGSEFSILGNKIEILADNTDLELEANGTGHVIINDNRLVIDNSHTPTTSSGVPGDRAGSIAWDANYLYVCFQDYVGPATACWRRIALPGTTW